MSEKAEFLAKVHDKCPYCERSFRKQKSSIDKKLIREMVEKLLRS